MRIGNPFAEALRTTWLSAGALVAATHATAHPVAQGRMRLDIRADHIAVRMTVPIEEVLVAAAHSAGQDGSLADSLRVHGAYLASHMQLVADGRALTGHVVHVPEQDATGWAEYVLEYGLTDRPATRIELRQDVLCEFEFAPGNSWEASYLVRIGRFDGKPGDELLLASRRPLAWQSTEATPGRARFATSFVRHGVRHILGGWDHLLFIAALALGAASIWNLVRVVAMFTLAHTITLTLAAFNLVRLPARIVEPMIAASIVCVALQNVFRPERTTSPARLATAFVFGLFHGLGFAGGLLQVMSGLPVTMALAAIGAFSIGVEIGHQAVVLPLFFTLRSFRRAAGAERRRRFLEWPLRRYGSALIALAGCFYLAEALR
jgi:hydrogenase/urease accessory protein HupE